MSTDDDESAKFLETEIFLQYAAQGLIAAILLKVQSSCLGWNIKVLNETATYI